MGVPGCRWPFRVAYAAILAGCRRGAAGHRSVALSRTGFTSSTGVLSSASRGRTSIRNPSVATTWTRCSPMGLGRSGERVLKTPRGGRAGSSRGRVASTSRAARSSQVSTMISVPAARSRIPLGELGLEDQPGVRRALVPLPRRLPPVGQRRLDPSDRHYLIAPHVHQRLPPRAAGMTTSVTVAAIPRHQPMRMTDPRCPGRLTTRCRVYTASIQPRIPVEVALPPNCPAAR